MGKLALIALIAVLSASAQVMVFQHADVIDGSGRPPLKDATLVVAQGKIRQLAGGSKAKYPVSAEVVDWSGKTVIPGIINLHGHVGMTKGLTQHVDHYTRENVEANLLTYARYGVTTTTSLGTDLDLIVRLRDEQRRGHGLGARVFTALQGFTTRAGYPTHVPGVKGVAQEVTGAAQARHWVNQLADKGADAVKMWVDDHHDTFEKLPAAVYGAIIQQARKRGVKTFAHVYELEDAKNLVRAGIDVLAHSIRDREVDEELITLLKKNGVTSVATLTREQSTFVYADSPSWLDDPFFIRGATSDVIQEVRTRLKAKQSRDPEREINRKGYEIAKRNLKTLSDAGVRIGFGTDTGPPARFPGFFEHWEMELMVEAGMNPGQVIESFSQNAAEALGVAKRLGTLAQGKAADFIVLDKDPLADIRNTRAIHAVYLGGRKVEDRPE